jgi:anti-sigma B factor antagonist
MLSYSGHEASGLMVLTVEESKPGEEVMARREWLYKTIEGRDDPRFVVDLGNIQYMQSSDIGVLITVKRRIEAKKGRVVLMNVDPFILDILRTMRIDKLFPVVTDLNEAVKVMSA